ncbi:hypothetical protein HS088_TW22G00367 [Tripterygium wilfordii]|uniref:Uncharacterized protein n=1 Tax=Tripterygium wilfordii TaxID=458696 RepID=A0A7J7BYS4_TRIWF|nr:uncharacterized protein LOC119991116 [Tripterygium wilfordii]KAF5726686.1 hypothetical protein HS088_TW22G00367 [Tripterygium wilfordii]
MPPSPALRVSPGREMRADNHKRGRSLEGGLLFKRKDDDLALFNEMQSREKEDFLLQSTDDFENTFSTKLKHFSDIKLEISIPVRGESSELLNADGEKNDYDWLLTPPETPLFSSLDDEQPPVNVVTRGRLRSHPISLSRSSTMEKGYRSSRGSASPKCLSPSPRSGNSTFQSRGRPSSAPNSSPSRNLRPATPVQRPSPPPSKPSTPIPRSSTPTSRRLSIGSNGTGVRGTSPIRTSRGNSASPKIRAWQSNIPGFSSEAPSNLRTSLGDRPASYVRGSSPASRNGRDLGSRVGRQSMSPTASRSVSSSHGHDRDQFSSHSRGSIASSGDDDVDSLQSVPVGSLDRLTSKRVGPSFSNNRAPSFSWKSSKIVSPGSASKRAFDPAVRQLDNRKSPQNMFRPLLSSVPSTTFYIGKASSAHRSMMSRNSSVTTSSNASSDQGTCAALDTEGSDHLQDDLACESGKVPYPDVPEEVFAFDKVEAFYQDEKHNTFDRSLHIGVDDYDRDLAIDCDPGNSDKPGLHKIDANFSIASDALNLRDDCSEVCSLKSSELCSRCGLRYPVTRPVENGINLCPDCCKKNNLATILDTIANDTAQPAKKKSEENVLDELEPLTAKTNTLSLTTEVDEIISSQHEENVKQSEACNFEHSQIYLRENSLPSNLVEGDEQSLANQQGMGQLFVGHSLPDNDVEGQQLQQNNDHIENVDVSEISGISILLNRSRSSKGSIVQGRTFIANSIPRNDLSYARDSTNSLRSSIGHGSASASSSVDFGSRQVETRVQRQLSGKKSDMENHRSDVNIKSQSIGLSLPGVSDRAQQSPGFATSMHEGASVADAKFESEERPVSSHEKLLTGENREVDVSDVAIVKENLLECTESKRTDDTSSSELLRHSVGTPLDENTSVSVPNYEDHALNETGEGFSDHARSASDIEALAITPESSIKAGNTRLSHSFDAVDVTEFPAQSTLDSVSEIQTEDCYQSMDVSQNEDVSTVSRSTINEYQEPSGPTPSDIDTAEKSTVMIECQGESKGRSLTLEEATDTILFCSSIVHDLAYEAATIAIEKESSDPVENFQPTVRILGKFNSGKKDPRGRNIARRSPKSQKPRQRRLETDVKPPLKKVENDENVDESMMQNVGRPKKMDSIKPPKLESKCNCTIM